MKKLIFLFCFLGLTHSISAQASKSKFMFTTKTAYAHFLKDYLSRKIYFGSEAGYFLDRFLLLGVNFDYFEYQEHIITVETENPGSTSSDIPGNKVRWYSFGLYGKLLFDVRRFTPFVKVGVGIYIPQSTYYKNVPTTQQSYWVKAAAYGKSCFGMNLGAGLHYRVWKGFCLQTEGAW